MAHKNRYTKKYVSDQANNNLFLFLVLALVAFTSVSTLILSSTFVSADESSANATVNVPEACTMTGSGMNTHTAEIPNGTYRADIGATTIKVVCNDPNGFSIYAIGFTGDEYTGTNHTKLVGTSASGNATIATGTATSGSTSNWAMKLATNSSATYPIALQNGYGSYSNVPDTYTKVAQRTSGTDTGTSATGSELTTTYAAFISSTQAADTYVGKVKYTLFHPYDDTPVQPVACTAGKICYQPNTSTVTGQMGNQTPSSSQITNGIPLWAPNFKRDGYGFAGWNTEFDYSGTTYGPNETITAPSDISTKGLSLYAVWVKSAGSLQNWSGCSSLAEGSVTALTDERDSDTYAVAKLADGKCWMIENLRLDNSPELSSTNTHNPSIAQLSPTTDPTQTAWCTAISSACFDQSMLATNNTTLFTNNTASSYSAESNVYSYGNYYNWYSATGGNGKYSTRRVNVSGDICPAGWHLPTSKDTSDEFGVLDIALGGTGGSQFDDAGTAMSKKYRSYPNNFVYSGYVDGSSFDRRNSVGSYWPASGNAYDSTYYLHFSSTGVFPGTGISKKYNGRLVRCLIGS